MSDLHQRLKAALLARVPADGTKVGNTTLRREVETQLSAEGWTASEADYWQVHADLIAAGTLVKGAGRGGTVRRAEMPTDAFSLAVQAPPPVEPAAAAPKVSLKSVPAARSTPAGKRAADEAPQIISYRYRYRYRYRDKHKNNPEVGMVTRDSDPEEGKARWAFDPHLDPALAFDPQRAHVEQVIDGALASGDADQMRDALEELKRLQSPYLNWAGKAERTSFDVDTVSLHVHERIDPASILAAVRKAMQSLNSGSSACRITFHRCMIYSRSVVSIQLALLC